MQEATRQQGCKLAGYRIIEAAAAGFKKPLHSLVAHKGPEDIYIYICIFISSGFAPAAGPSRDLLIDS